MNEFQIDHAAEMLEALRSTRAEKVPFGNDSVNDWAARVSNFTNEFTGRLAEILSQSPEGRDAWTKALAETSTYAPNEVA
ncbi:hypothetical protein ACIRON_03020 [Nocardioides sp. NPDC101246]|uniref:hypothetical protein n=1 Tax=Nocardioides sp. NPDC101246 TaxID=3364336 RepID=UPI00380E0EE9